MSWGNPKSLQEKLLATALSPVSLVWQSASLTRLFAYGHGILPSAQFDCPIVSIGNLTVGGTGKTPITIDVCRRLLAQGYRPAILSRGYKRQSKEKILVASDGQGNIADCASCGDEPYMMAQALPAAVVIVASKRAQAAELAVRNFGCNVLVLDDGFQHLALSRSQDIVLIDYEDDPANDRVLPAGRLREPLSSLARADWVVLTKVPRNYDHQKLVSIHHLIHRWSPQTRFSLCRFVPSDLTTFAKPQTKLQPQALAGARIMTMSGIARPERFNDELRDLGAIITATRSFDDHHWFSQSDMNSIKRDCQASGASMLVTTQKDAARLTPDLVGDLPLFVLGQEVEWLGPVPDFATAGTSQDKQLAGV